MLQLSRIENGTTKFNPEKTDMIRLVRSVVEAQEQLFSDRGLRLKLDVKTNRRELICEVDRDMIRQAVINLMSNAIRYTPEEGYVVVTVSPGGPTCSLVSVETRASASPRRTSPVSSAASGARTPAESA